VGGGTAVKDGGPTVAAKGVANGVYGSWIVAKTISWPANRHRQGDNVSAQRRHVATGGNGSMFDVLREDDGEAHQSQRNPSSSFTFGLQSRAFGSVMVGPGSTADGWGPGDVVQKWSCRELDRWIRNEVWSVMCPDNMVFHLPRLHSDHTPLLVRACRAPRPTGLKPFHFLASRLTHESFDSLVEHVWSSRGSYDAKVGDFISKASEWNSNVFGNIFQRKRRLLARIGGIPRTRDFGRNPFLRSLEQRLKVELDEVLFQEELLLLQKSQRDWVLFGDRNSSYYHQLLKHRRRKNKIVVLQDEMGVMIEKHAALQSMAVEFSKNIYFVPQFGQPVVCISGSFPPLEVSHSRLIARDISESKVLGALKKMAPLKAPGVDGLHALFFQQKWKHVGPSVCAQIFDIWREGRVPSSLNMTLLVLIPKVDNSMSLMQFRPISLLNVVYKLLTKVLAERIKLVVPSLINPAQASFVPGRHITDNIIIAQELIHSMRVMKGKHGVMVVKVDLEKAYDFLRWEFVRDTLELVGFPRAFVEAVMACVTSASKQLQWNGVVSEEFKPSRGIRQG
ncbi:Unknown protein, partial [Striga hermonthica]